MGVSARRAAVLVLSMVAATALAAEPARAAGSQQLQAESYAAQHGTTTSPAPYPSGGLLVNVSDGDRLRYDAVTVDRVRHTLACFTSTAPVGTVNGTLELRLDDPSAAPALTISVRTNISGGAKQLAWAGALVPDGTHTLYLRVRQPAGAAPFALDYLLLTEYPPPPTLSCF